MRVGLRPELKTNRVRETDAAHTPPAIPAMFAKTRKIIRVRPDRLTGRFTKRLRAAANYRQNPISNFLEGDFIGIRLTTVWMGNFRNPDKNWPLPALTIRLERTADVSGDCKTWRAWFKRLRFPNFAARIS